MENNRYTPPRRDPRQDLANLLGKPRYQVNLTELEYFFQYLTGSGIPDSLGQKLITCFEAGAPDSLPAKIRRRVQVAQLAEEIFDSQHSHFPSYGMYVPTYMSALNEQKIFGLNEPIHTSLFIGTAVTEPSKKEHAATVGHVFEGCKTDTLDVLDLETDPHNSFPTLPFGENSQSSIQTLNTLVNLHKPPEYSQEVAVAYFKELMRILKPGGSLVMCEPNLGYGEDDTEDYQIIPLVVSAMCKAGFQASEGAYATQFKTRRQMNMHIDRGFGQMTDLEIDRRTIVFKTHKSY